MRQGRTWTCRAAEITAYGLSARQDRRELTTLVISQSDELARGFSARLKA